MVCLLKISLAGCGQLVKMLILVNNMVYLDGMFVEHQSSWLWSVSENAHYSWTTWYICMVCLLNISLAGCGQLVKMLILVNNMVYLDGMFVEHQSSWLWSVSENAHYSWTTWYICMVCLLNISLAGCGQLVKMLILVNNTVYLYGMFVEHQASWLWSVSENAHYSWTTWYICMVCLLNISLAGCDQ